MVDKNKRALTRRKIEWAILIDDENDEKIVYLVKFGMCATVCLTAIEIASLALLRAWNSEVFAAISGISGIIFGILIGRKR